MQRLLRKRPAGLRIHAMESTLHVLGPDATAMADAAGDLCEASLRGLQDPGACDDFVPLGRITDSGGW